MAAGGRKQQVMSSGVVVALVALLVVAAAAASADAAKICNIERSALETCRSYCQGGSQESSPSQGCCDAVRGADVKCFCGLRAYLARFGAGLDPNRAMQIPSKCGFGGATPCH